jgi:hypothetical protein
MHHWPASSEAGKSLMVWLLLHILLLGWLSYCGYFYCRNTSLRLYYWPAFAFKIAAGTGVGLLYFFYYGSGDVFGYDADANRLASLALEDVGSYLAIWAGNYPAELELVFAGEERALLTAKIFSLFYLFTNSNFWLASAWLSFFSFLASFFLTVRLASYRPFLQKAAPLAFLFWPSHIFWTSGLLKESLAMPCLALIAATTLPYILAGKKLKLWELLVSVGLTILLFKLKYYYAGLFIPFLGCLLLVCWLKRRYKLTEVLAACIYLLLLVLGVLLASQLHPNLYPSRILEVMVNNYYLFAKISAEGSFVEYPHLSADWRSVLHYMPKALFAGLYEPLFPLEPYRIIELAACAENALLLLLTVMAFGGWLLKPGEKVWLNLLAVLGYVGVFAIFMGIAAPNYGTLLRYRVGYHPFFVLMVLAGTKYFIAWVLQRVKTG